MAHPLKPSGGASPAPAPAPSPALPGWVSPPGPSVLCAPGVAARFIADFDRKNGVDHSDQEQAVRVLRPGTIVLANLDLDAPPSPRPANVIPVLDCADDKINGGDDEPGLTALKLRQQLPSSIVATKITLSCHSDDAKRIRIFQAGLPAGTASKIGPAAGKELQVSCALPPAIDFLIEAISLAGDPSLKAPADAPPIPPEGVAATLPAGASAANPLYTKRAPGEIWLELEHAVNPPFRPVRDVALVTIAPWLMLPNTCRVERLFFTYEDKGRNHDFAYDLCEACRVVFGAAKVKLDPDESKLFTPSTPASSEAVYLADGATYPDVWMQDELEIGYCWAPHAWMHVALHNPRNRELDDFVRGEIAGPGIGVFDAVAPSGNASVNYGGNLEVSPPVSVATPAIPKSEAGPSIKAHPAAPFGKIIMGDCKVTPVAKKYHDFLVAQGVQPVLAMDTSWLDVGHVDEFMSFIPSTSGKGWKLVFASIGAMDVLLQQCQGVPIANGRAGFHAGRFNGKGKYAEESVEEMLGYKKWNADLRTKKLMPLQRRLERGLGISAADIIQLPTYFEIPEHPGMNFSDPKARTIAWTVGSVNMQVVNGHLMVPRPFGPRMKPADAKKVVEQTMKRIGWIKPVRVASATGYYFWAEPGLKLDFYAASFAKTTSKAARDNIVQWMKGGAAPLTPANNTLIIARRDEIRNHANNGTGPNPIAGALDATGTFTKWKRLFIPDDRVDVLEVYMRSVFEAEGCTVHFIDDWNAYHIAMGEVHCGTNVIRTPPELEAGFTARWWDRYDPEIDLSYDPSS